MAEATLKLDIPQDAVRAVVAAEVAKTIGNPEQFFAAMVTQFLTEKVRDSGTYREEPRIVSIVHAEVKKIALECLQETLAASKPAIQKQLRVALASNRYAESLTKALLEAVSSGAISHRLTVDLSLGSNR